MPSRGTFTFGNAGGATSFTLPVAAGTTAKSALVLSIGGPTGMTVTSIVDSSGQSLSGGQYVQTAHADYSTTFGGCAYQFVVANSAALAVTTGSITIVTSLGMGQVSITEVKGADIVAGTVVSGTGSNIGDNALNWTCSLTTADDNTLVVVFDNMDNSSADVAGTVGTTVDVIDDWDNTGSGTMYEHAILGTAGTFTCTVVADGSVQSWAIVVTAIRAMPFVVTPTPNPIFFGMDF